MRMRKEVIVYTCSNEKSSDGKIVDYTERCDSVKELFGTFINVYP